MRYQIPQFIEVEDKIFGPLTLKQFIYLAGGGGMCVIVFLFLNFWLAILVCIPIIALAISLAFFKINNKPLVFVIESAFKYLLNPKLYIWRHEAREATPTSGKKSEEEPTSAFIPKLSDSKLKDLSWELDAKEPLTTVVRKGDTV